MDTGLVGLIVALAGVVSAAIYIYRKGATVESVTDGIRLVWDASRLVEEFAPAADQLVKIGQLKPEDRRDYVLNLVLQYVDDIDPEAVIGLIESWVAQQKRAA